MMNSFLKETNNW